MAEVVIVIVCIALGILFGYGFWKEIGAKERRELERLSK